MPDRLTPIFSNVVDMTASPETLPVSEIGTPKSDFSSSSKRKLDGKKVWIDIDNSPHVPFFLPIIRELEKYGVELILTARDMYQVSELVEFFNLPCHVVGSHYGKNKFLKVLGSLLRAAQLIPTASKLPTLALSAGSRAQILACKVLGIPTVMMHDYEHSIKTGFIEPDWILVPDVIPERAMSKNPARVLKYPGHHAERSSCNFASAGY
jgi:predicted glycosyltransferase